MTVQYSDKRAGLGTWLMVAAVNVSMIAMYPLAVAHEQGIGVHYEGLLGVALFIVWTHAVAMNGVSLIGLSFDQAALPQPSRPSPTPVRWLLRLLHVVGMLSVAAAGYWFLAMLLLIAWALMYLFHLRAKAAWTVEEDGSHG